MNNGSKVANFRRFLCMNFRTQHNAWKFNQKPPLWAVLYILGGRSWIVIPIFAFALWAPFAYGSNRWFSSHYPITKN